MPLFKYQCLNCNKIFEELVTGNVDKVPCPECKSDKTLKMVSLVSVKKNSAAAGSGCDPNTCASAKFG